MYTIINTRKKIYVFDGVFRDWLRANADDRELIKDAEVLMVCNDKLEVKTNIRQFIRLYRRNLRTVICPFNLKINKRDKVKLGIRNWINWEGRLKQSRAKKGKKNPNWGGFTDEHRANLSKARKGVGNFKGKKHTPETKAKISARLKGKRNCAGWGWIHTEDNNNERKWKYTDPIPQGWIRGRIEGTMQLAQEYLRRGRVKKPVEGQLPDTSLFRSR